MQRKRSRAHAIPEELRLTREDRDTITHYARLDGQVDARYERLGEGEQRLVKSATEAIRRGQLGNVWAYLRLQRYFPEQVEPDE